MTELVFSRTEEDDAGQAVLRKNRAHPLVQHCLAPLTLFSCEVNWNGKVAFHNLSEYLWVAITGKRNTLHRRRKLFHFARVR